MGRMGENFRDTSNKPQDNGALSRLIGTFYVVVGAAGMFVMLFSSRPFAYEAFNEPFAIIAGVGLFLALITIGLVMSLSKRNPKTELVK